MTDCTGGEGKEGIQPEGIKYQHGNQYAKDKQEGASYWFGHSASIISGFTNKTLVPARKLYAGKIFI